MSESVPAINDGLSDTTAGPDDLPPPPSDISETSAPMRNSKKIEKSNIEFVMPDKGTPAAAALEANEAMKMTKLDKLLSKFRGLKRPKIKSLNVLKQLKKHTKLRRKAHKNFKGKVIDGQHELYVITAGIMLGMKCSLSHNADNFDDDDMLTLDAFNFVEKASFPALGSDEDPYPTPPHSLVRTFKFKTYAPRVFARLRSLCDIQTDKYMESICGNYNFLEFSANSKSGQFFFYSHDGKYMLKTQTKEENRFMKCILPHYYRYLAENPHSFLCRILGMHRVKMYQFRRKVHFVIMTSVFDTPEKIHTIYDLKGSLVGREATPKEKENGAALKDNDLLERTGTGEKLHLGVKKELFLAQIDKDAKFLASLGIMDYSLLLGIHFRDRRHIDRQPVFGTSDIPGNNDGSGCYATLDRSGPQTDTPMTRANRAHRASESSELMGTILEEVDLKIQSFGGEKITANSEDAISSNSTTASSEILIQGGSPIPLQPPEGSNISEVANDDDDESSIAISVSEGNSSYIASDDDDESIIIDRDEDDQSVDGGDKDVSLLLSRNIAYSDTNGLKYPEGSRLSGILSLRNAPSPTSGLRSRGNSHDAIYAGTAPSSTSEAATTAATTTTAAAVVADSSTAESDSSKHRSSAKGGTIIGENEVIDQAIEGLHQEQSARAFFGHHPWTNRSDGGINSRMPDSESSMRGNEIYYCGVIDILQKYNFRKQSESIMKGIAGWDTDKISAVNPDRYAKRFIDFLRENID